MSDQRSEHKPPFLAPVRGVIAGLLVVIWLTILFSIFLPTSLLKILVPIPKFQYFITSVLLGYVWLWIGFVNWIGRWATGIEIDVQGFENINKRGCYFIFANHSAWTDIVILFHLYHGRMPFPRWFMKRELIWVPMIGYVCWAVDMPFMYRVTPEKLRKNPKLKGKDLEVTRRSCEKFRTRPVVITNYLEGTRFTWEKHAKQESPYRNLLTPRYGGAAFTMSAMGELLDGVIDMTVVFPPGHEPSCLNYALGKVPKVVVRARMLSVPEDIIKSNLRDDRQARERFKQWINEIWEYKDRQIDEIKAELEAEFGVKYERPSLGKKA
ncbi:MAG: acetyltransferase [Salinisphaeraceae bacterium]|nr:acetyltransferase [Salinisphaeraceae bacterium]